MRYKYILLFFCIPIISAIGLHFYFYIEQYDSDGYSLIDGSPRNFICKNTDYKKLSLGDSREAIERIVGKPIGTYKREDNQVEQVYSIPEWSGTISLLFDSQSILMWKTCGYG